MPERKAEVILKIAQAIGNQLGISELLASLNETLNPIVHFDATGIVTLEGDAVTVHWAHLDELTPSAGESVERVVGRYASRIKVEPPPMKIPVSDHPISVIMKTGQPYIASDLAVERGFDTDEPLLNMGFRSYIDLPLVNQGQLIGTIKFLSREKAQLHERAVGPVAGHLEHCRHRCIECFGLRRDQITERATAAGEPGASGTDCRTINL